MKYPDLLLKHLVLKQLPASPELFLATLNGPTQDEVRADAARPRAGARVDRMGQMGETVYAARSVGAKVVDSTVSSLVSAVERGEVGAAEPLFTALYSELHRLAQRELAGRGANIGLGVTTLLHEAYLDMAARSDASFPDRARFMAYAARVMRGLIVDHARNHLAQKRGGQFEITSLRIDGCENVPDHRELTAISDALDALAKSDPSLVQVVDLKFFCGFSFAEIAAMQDVSERTVRRKWEKARIYLHHSIGRRPVRQNL